MENIRGIAMMVTAVALFSCFDALVKFMSASLPIGLVLMSVSVFGALIFITLSKLNGQAAISKRALHPAVIGRCVCELLTAVCITLAVIHNDLSVFAAVLQATPITMTLVAVLFMGEQVGWRRWSMILLGFTGILIIVRPFAEGFDANVLLAFLAMLLQAGRDLFSRKVPKTTGNLELATYGMISTIPSGLIILALHGTPDVVDMSKIWMIPLLLGFGTLGYLCITASVRLGDVAVVLPFRYTRLIFSIAIGMAFFAERPDLWTWIGAATVVGSGLYTLYREMQVTRVKKHQV